MNLFVQYLRDIYKSRYFWWNLSLADLRFKYRRSFLGILWSIIQPLAMTALLSIVMGRFFSMQMSYLAPYMFIGMIVWELLLTSVMNGCNALVNAESYIKLFKHPMTIYPLRSSITVFINFLLAGIGVLAWSIITMPQNFCSFAWLAFFPAGLLLFLLCWCNGIICAFFSLRFSDLPQLIVIVMQMLWYISPVFFPLDLFRKSRLDFLLQYNPVYHILELFRQPLLHGAMPNAANWLWSLGWVIFMVLCAGLSIVVLEKKSIYYL